MQFGADTQRVETTVHHLGTALGAEWLDVFVSPNALIISTTDHEEFRTKVRRVMRLGGVNMAGVAAISQLVYAAEELDRHTISHRLDEIATKPRHYGRSVQCILVGLACAAFSLLFGGDWAVFGTTWVAASVAMLIRHEMTRRQHNFALNAVVTAFVATLLASSATLFGWSNEPQIALAASVLLLVPGVPLVNAVEDLLSEHWVVGIVRGVVGLIMTLSVALGIAVALALLQIGRIWDSFSPDLSLAADMLLAGIAALGFAVLFNVAPRILWGSVLCAALGHGLRYLLIRAGWQIEAATLGGALLIGVLGYWLARWQRVPAMIFTISGVIPMVPGTFAFGTMIGLLRAVGMLGGAENSTDTLVQSGLDAVRTGLILVSLAVGIVLPRYLFTHRKSLI
jgi:uncharacterized membrane protein YjjP (DUF1212 family)